MTVKASQTVRAAKGARVLFVCNANVCRSPLAQGLLLSAVGPGWQVDSAGVRAEPGLPMIAKCRDILADKGVMTDQFRSRRLTIPAVTRAEVLIAMTRSELREVLRVDPTALRRAVTLAELDRCAAGPHRFTRGVTPADRLKALVAQAIRDRGLLRPAQPEDDDIPDPVGGDEVVLDAVTAAITTAVDAVVAVIASDEVVVPVQEGGSTLTGRGTG